MPRPRKCCYIAQPPAVAGMRPVGGDSVAPEAVTLRYDEYEAIRLIDHQGLTQAAAAERIRLSKMKKSERQKLEEENALSVNVVESDPTPEEPADEASGVTADEDLKPSQDGESDHKEEQE